MIHLCQEGENTREGFNVVSIYDGGHALILWLWRLHVYSRIRGRHNPAAKPRLIFNWEWGKTFREAKAESDRMMSDMLARPSFGAKP